MSDELFEVEEKVRMRREEAAERLRALADQLARHNSVEFTQGGLKVTAKVPDEVDVELEIEISEDGGEIEVEISW